MPLVIGAKQRIFRGRWLDVWETEFLDKNGERQTWEWIDRKGAVYVFPITPEQHVVLIRNFRIPIERYVIEMPAGVKDHGENDQETAKRELQEETGYCAQHIIPVRSWPYRPGTSNAHARGFIATGLIKGERIGGDATEDIEVIEVPRDQLFDFYFSLPQEELFDTTIIALHALALHLGING